MRRCFAITFSIFFSLLAFSCSDDSLHDQAKEAIKKSASYIRSISTNGGYVGIYSVDSGKSYGEGLYMVTDMNQIWVEPPGTPTVGEFF